MPQFVLSAYPGNREVGSGYSGVTLELTTLVIPRRTVEARNVAELAKHAHDFGEEAAKAPRGASFLISVTVARGHRKFRGFDAADDTKQFHNEKWLKTVEKEKA